MTKSSEYQRVNSHALLSRLFADKGLYPEYNFTDTVG